MVKKLPKSGKRGEWEWQHKSSMAKVRKDFYQLSGKITELQKVASQIRKRDSFFRDVVDLDELIDGLEFLLGNLVREKLIYVDGMDPAEVDKQIVESKIKDEEERPWLKR
jgi:hypothetical protein